MALWKLATKAARISTDDPEEFRATLVEHLEDLRDRILRAVLLLAGGWVAGWFLEPGLYEFLNNLIRRSIERGLPKGAHYEEAFRNMTEPFMLQLRLSFLIGLIIVFPFIVLQLWGFVAPGLKPNERKPFKVLAPYTVLLFCVGCGFCWIILPACLSWFTTFLGAFKGTGLIQEPGSMVFFILKMMLAFGIGFQLPLVVYALGALGLLSAATLIKYWRQSSLGIFVVAAVLTPSNDAFSMLMMAVPLVILFLISVYAVKLLEKKRERAKKRQAVTGGD